LVSSMIEWVAKRDGRVVPFDAEKIADAIFAAAKAVGGEDRRQAEFLAGQVIHLLSQSLPEDGQPQVEQIQDLVEKVLIEHGHARTAKAYILYRNRRTRIREQKSELMDAVSEVLQESGADLLDVSTPSSKLRRIALAASEQYTLHSLLPREFAAAHQRGAMHIDQMAEYSLSVAACVVEPTALTRHGIRLGRTYLPPVKTLTELVRLLGRIVLLAQNEMIGELLFCDLDRAVATLDTMAEPTAMRAEVQQLLADLDLARAMGGPRVMPVTVSLGLDPSAVGREFTRALLDAVQAGLPSGALVISPQVLLQVAAEQRDSDLLQCARRLARERGNPSLMLALGPRSPVFASGLRLQAGESAVLARTFVNLPRIALEAVSSSDLWSGIDASLSLAVRQLVHRFEVLSALPEWDLPLLLAGNATAGAAGEQVVQQVLQTGQLSLVPVGLPEALQVARLRFGNAITLEEAELAQLQLRIVEHWREHYALRLTIGQVASETAARRFLDADRQTFPLARTLWPDMNMYSPAAPSAHFLGGQFISAELPDAAPPNVVFAADFAERHCPICGARFTADACPRGCAVPPVGVLRGGGYLHSC